MTEKKKYSLPLLLDTQEFLPELLELASKDDVIIDPKFLELMGIDPGSDNARADFKEMVNELNKLYLQAKRNLFSDGY